MVELNDRLRDVKERIKKRLRELEEEEKRLMNKMDGLDTLTAQLKGLRMEIRKGVSQPRLREIAEELDLSVRVHFPFTALAKYFVVKRLEQRVKEIKHRNKEIAYRIKSIKSEVESVFICPDCNGLGFRTKTRYMRENGFVAPTLISTKCPICQGKGRIGLDNAD